MTGSKGFEKDPILNPFALFAFAGDRFAWHKNLSIVVIN